MRDPRGPGVGAARAVRAAVCAVILLVPVRTAAIDPWRPADVGEWRVVWSVSEALGWRNDFPELGLEVDFPVRWRLVEDSTGRRLVWFDAAGEVARVRPLGPGERALAADDGTAYVLWTYDPIDLDVRHVSYWEPDAEAPVWEASVRGEPCLIAPDGGVVVLTSARVGEDGHSVVLPGGEGRVQLVGASGELREELPFAPTRAAFTGDGRRIVMLRPRELVALGRDGSRAWSAELAIDDVAARAGLRPLACANGLIAIAGTSNVRQRYRGGLWMERAGRVQVRTDDGRRLWERTQAPDEETWFETSLAFSPEGSRLAMTRSGPRGLIVSLHEARTGAIVWERLDPRRMGLRTLSVARDGRMTVVAHAAGETLIGARDAEGNVVFEGLVPLEAKRVEIADGDLIVADRWVLQIRPASDDGS